MLELPLLLGDLTVHVRMQKVLRRMTKMKQATVLPLETIEDCHYSLFGDRRVNLEIPL